MDTRAGTNGAADAKDFLAEERTFLAWIRTGMAVMAFGFVVARFGLFLEQIRIARGADGAEPHSLSLWFGAVLMTAGVATTLFAARRHRRVVAALRRRHFDPSGSSTEAIILAWFLACVGLALLIYLAVAR